jgi:hypothetical protein
MQIEVTDAIVDQIIKTELRDSIDGVKRDITRLKRIRHRQKYEDADLKHSGEILPHLEAVYDYFGGNLK